MPRRVALPGASELFRPTTGPADGTPDSRHRGQSSVGSPGSTGSVDAEGARDRHDDLAPGGPGRDGYDGRATQQAERDDVVRTDAESLGSGRIRHTEKITVYLSTDELLALEQARLSLRSAYGTAVDRGRIVRAAIGIALDGLAADGADADLLRRLSNP